jgi:hypothetical protein
MTEITPEMRLMLTRAIMQVFDSWRLQQEEMQCLLGMPGKVRTLTFQKYRTHLPFPEDPATDRRVDYLLAIAGALRTTFPTSAQMAARWLRQPHRRFGRPPLAVMLERGEEGLVQVLADLDCTVCWDLNDNVTPPAGQGLSS